MKKVCSFEVVDHLDRHTLASCVWPVSPPHGPEFHQLSRGISSGCVRTVTSKIARGSSSSVTMKVSQNKRFHPYDFSCGTVLEPAQALSQLSAEVGPGLVRAQGSRQKDFSRIGRVGPGSMS